MARGGSSAARLNFGGGPRGASAERRPALPAERAAPARAGLAFATAFGALLVVYAATLAPGVTFWDAGEFLAAVHAFGIPHPPGTPLFVVLARAWAALLPFLSTALATNLLSAVCSAGAGAIAAALVARWTGQWLAGLAAALAAGTMSTVWLNATETEVYAVALLLVALTLWAADGAGKRGDERRVVLTGYLIAVAVPLHASALVAAPAAIALAAQGPEGEPRPRVAIALGATFVLAMAATRLSPWLAGAGTLALVALALRPSGADEPRAAGLGRAAPLALLGVALVAFSALLALLARARLDPAINQGNPSTLAALLDVVGRRQYAVAPLWPRQAPVWLQLANLFQYADWQVALGAVPSPLFSVERAALTALFLWLGVEGSRAHRRADRRSWRAMVVLLVAASLGTLVYLNFKAGPSIGYGILPDDVPHEARDRDYFFVLAFWCWGLWAGIGAVALARAGRPARAPWGVALAALPLLLNWPVADRRREPDASTPRLVAETLLRPLPPRAVLFVWGDNDTYPLWYAQQAMKLRRDVRVVTVPLLPAPWYREELARRDALNPASARWPGSLVAAAREVADRARGLGRPVAVAVTIPASARDSLGGPWRFLGMAFVEDPAAAGDPAGVAVDRGRASALAGRLAPWLAAHPPTAVTDVTTLGMWELFACPRLAAAWGGGDPPPADSLATLCNFR